MAEWAFFFNQYVHYPVPDSFIFRQIYMDKMMGNILQDAYLQDIMTVAVTIKVVLYGIGFLVCSTGWSDSLLVQKWI